MPLLETKGAASAQGFGLTLQQTAANYIEDVFSTWLYTGNNSTQTITNGIDLAGKGGLVWLKARNIGGSTWQHFLMDTDRGAGSALSSNTTDASTSGSNYITSFLADGFVLGPNGSTNSSGNTQVSWTFRKQPKFFDVVTYTGNGTAGRAISHSLGSVPGCIILKNTAPIGSAWKVWHRSANGGQSVGTLNATVAFNTTDPQNYWGNNSVYIAPTSTTFTVSNDVDFNNSGDVYVAYIFAHDAGGFGLTGTDNVISCGSFTTDGSGNATVTLGYEPQFVLMKASSTAASWALFDNMRGMPVSGSVSRLLANSSAAETQQTDYIARPTATGFNATATGLGAGVTFIYIAIRRGPMKTPTTGTSVYTGVSQAGGGTVTTNFPVDLAVSKQADNALAPPTWFDRLRGSALDPIGGPLLQSSNTNAEVNNGVGLGFANNTGYVDGAFGNVGPGRIYWNLRRAPGFFDVVCYTGTGSATTQAHNLGVVPELMIVKRRNAGSENDWWPVYSKAPFNDPVVYQLNTTSGAFNLTSVWNFTNPTASVFSVGTSQTTNASGGTYVAYLFASCPGVSKCGSYTGTGALQTIDCGFTGGARFVLIKRYDTTGDWWVYDSARGITSGNDPYLFLNSTAAEVTGTNYVDTTSVGFQVTAAAPAGLNANGGTYIFLAVA